LNSEEIEYDNFSQVTAQALGLYHWYPFAGRPWRYHRESAFESTGLYEAHEPRRRVVETTHTPEIRFSSLGRPFVFDGAKLTDEYEMGESAEVATLLLEVAETRAVNEFGDETSSTSGVLNGQGQQIEQTTTTHVFEPTPQELTDWRISLPRKHITVSSRDGRQVERTQQVEYTSPEGAVHWI
jgi:hypothetical protein